MIIRKELMKYGLPAPEFEDRRGQFSVKFYKVNEDNGSSSENPKTNEAASDLILFCKTPRTRKEIADYLGISSVSYAIQTYVMPLTKAGKIHMSIPDRPRSPRQLYYSD